MIKNIIFHFSQYIALHPSHWPFKLSLCSDFYQEKETIHKNRHIIAVWTVTTVIQAVGDFRLQAQVNMCDLILLLQLIELTTLSSLSLNVLVQLTHIFEAAGKRVELNQLVMFSRVTY